MKVFSSGPREMVASAWRNRSLIVQMTVREVVGRYRGSLIGLAWSFFHPVLLLAVYTFVFSVVFKARWNVQGETQTEFALVLFAGLLVYNLFAECLARAPTLVLSNANYVKKIVFPLEILPWVSLGSALFHLCVSLVAWLIFYFVVIGLPSPTLLWLPMILLPLLALTLGLCWVLASLGAYLRDIGQVIGIVTTMLMFLSPILYPASALPEKWQAWLFLNPLTLIIEQSRNVMLWGRSPEWASLGVFAALSMVFAYLGFSFFQKTRRGFADVL